MNVSVEKEKKFVFYIIYAFLDEKYFLFFWLFSCFHSRVEPLASVCVKFCNNIKKEDMENKQNTKTNESLWMSFLSSPPSSVPDEIPSPGPNPSILPLMWL